MRELVVGDIQSDGRVGRHFLLRPALAAITVANIWCEANTKVTEHQKETAKKAKMVYYFTSNLAKPSATIYVGKDKVESEEFASSAFHEQRAATDSAKMRI